MWTHRVTFELDHSMRNRADQDEDQEGGEDKEAGETIKAAVAAEAAITTSTRECAVAATGVP